MQITKYYCDLCRKEVCVIYPMNYYVKSPYPHCLSLLENKSDFCEDCIVSIGKYIKKLILENTPKINGDTAVEKEFLEMEKRNG
jgi:hypothetical protein